MLQVEGGVRWEKLKDGDTIFYAYCCKCCDNVIVSCVITEDFEKGKQQAMDALVEHWAKKGKQHG